MLLNSRWCELLAGFLDKNLEAFAVYLDDNEEDYGDSVAIIETLGLVKDLAVLEEGGLVETRVAPVGPDITERLCPHDAIHDELNKPNGLNEPNESDI